MVDGQLVKKDGKLTDPSHEDVKSRFLESARKIQKTFRETPYPELEGNWEQSGAPFATPQIADIEPGNGTGYGQLYLDQ